MAQFRAWVAPLVEPDGEDGVAEIFANGNCEFFRPPVDFYWIMNVNMGGC